VATEEAFEHVWAASAVLGMVAALLALRVLLECAAALAAVLRAVQESAATTTAGSLGVAQPPVQAKIAMARNRTITPGRRGDGIMDHAHYTDVTLYRRLLRQARPYRLHIVGIFLLSLLQSPLALLTPLPLKIAVDSVV